MLCKPSPVPGRHDDAPEKPGIEAAERRTPTGTVEVEDRSPVSQEWETTLDQYRVQFLVLDRNDDAELFKKAMHTPQPGDRTNGRPIPDHGR